MVKTENLPANPYLAPIERLEDREGYPFKVRVNAVQVHDMGAPTDGVVARMENGQRTTDDTTAQQAVDVAEAAGASRSSSTEFRRKLGLAPANLFGLRCLLRMCPGRIVNAKTIRGEIYWQCTLCERLRG